MSLFRVFVYGTLKPGQANYFRIASFVVDSVEATIRGRLYNLRAGYPAVRDGDDIVHGYLFSFVEPTVLDNLDDLEGFIASRDPCDNLYNRETVVATTAAGEEISAFVYRMSVDRITSMDGEYVDDGYWSSNKFPSAYVGEALD